MRSTLAKTALAALVAIIGLTALAPLAANAASPTPATPVPYPIVQVFGARLEPGVPTCTSNLPTGSAIAKQLRNPVVLPGREALHVEVAGLRCIRDHDLTIIVTSAGRTVRIGDIHIDAEGNGRANFGSSAAHPLPRFHEGDEIALLMDTASTAQRAVAMKGVFHELFVP